MERNGWLRRIGNAPHACARQMFRITPEGKRLLEALRREVTELYQEIVLDEKASHRSNSGSGRAQSKKRA